ncbi:hypothetical protein BDY19DRAFT_904330 [Irpex rosettiformis]|uniref:Uncharacterized protein n=1 Tax=Irpex rosettiformis TaxID=378272 RepID=A0ACB8UBD6_9APHY|nr:hypothetical protein BDY19DRAFT_904330 [Irpex rosettiformis]
MVNRLPLALPPIPRVQALHSTTFQPPPLDGSLTVSEAQDWHYEHSPNHPLFVYSDGNGINTTILWSDAVPAIHRAGYLVREIAQKNKYTSRPIFGILASNERMPVPETITYFTLLSGILRAGYSAFVISPRNSAAAVTYLLTRVSVSHVFVGSEDLLQDVSTEALKTIGDNGIQVPSTSRFPLFESLYTKNSNFTQLPVLDVQWDDQAVYLHSSGSTAFPKPLSYTHEQLMLVGLCPCFGERDLTGERFGFHSMPIFHGMGVMQLGWSAFAGLILTTFQPQTPPIVPTPGSIMKGIMDTKSVYTFCVPSFVEAWATNPSHVEYLKSMQGILYGGGPLSDAVGDDLAGQGVSIFPVYGNTEGGLHSVVLPSKAGGVGEWAYFAFSGVVKSYWDYDDEGNAELWLVSHSLQKPNVINVKANGEDAYATNDVFTPHPTKPGFWKIFGRKDDQIMHSTGEKTNPGPLESMLIRDTHVQAAVMFGRGRFNAGVLIDPKPAFKFDPANTEKLAEFRNAIWPTVEKLNAFAPQHSRIFKEMIIVSTPNKPFAYTAKNTPRRQSIIDDYDSEIDALYSEVEQTAQADVKPPSIWDLAHVTPFVREVIQSVLTRTVEDTDDIFVKGCDSLQATYIRNTLLRTLKAVGINTRALPNGFVYLHPTIIALAAFLVGQASPDMNKSNSDLKDRAISEMAQMLEKYGSDFPSHTPSEQAKIPSKDVVVLTGTTGALGAAILAALAVDPDIEHIYALNRKGTKPLVDRHWSTFKERGLDIELLKLPKVTLLEAEVQDEEFGLSQEAFKQPNIKSVRRLIDLAFASPHSSPAQFLFVSSVGVLRNITETGPVLEAAVSPIVSTGVGYSESKWVAENLLELAARNTSLRPTSVRVGQISGSASGAWNQTEWFPSLVKSSVTLGALPSISSAIQLIPLDAAARTIIELRNANEPYLHLAHPIPTPFSTILQPMSRELELPIVPFEEWSSSLERSGEALNASAEVEITRNNPALKLLDFFASEASRSSEDGAFGIKTLDITKARRLSHTLNELPELTETDVLGWLKYWRSVGFIN